MKRLLANAALALAYGAYVFLWCGSAFFLYGLHIVIGFPKVISDAFGTWSVYLGIAVALIAVTSPLWLWKTRRWRRIRLAFLITFAFIILFFGVFYGAILQFQEFTPEKWMEYPNERWIMAEDMLHTVMGMDHAGVAALLGAPDAAYDGRWLYLCGDDYVEIISDDAGVVYAVDVH